MIVGDPVVFKWLGIEDIGFISSIEKRDYGNLYWVARKKDSSIYPCSSVSRFGIILKEKTEALQEGTYIKIEKTDIDIIMEELEKSFTQLKDLHSAKFPKRKTKEAKELIKTIKRQLNEIYKLIDTVE